MTGLNHDELRIIAMSAPLWLRMLRTREERIIRRMYGDFRNGKTDHLTAIAELACVRDQIFEIEAAVRQLNKPIEETT